MRTRSLPLESIMIFNARAEGYVQYGFKPNPLGFVTRTDAELELYEPHRKHRGRLEHVVRVGPGRLIGIGAGGLVARIGRTEVWLSGLPRVTPH